VNIGMPGAITRHAPLPTKIYPELPNVRFNDHGRFAPKELPILDGYLNMRQAAEKVRKVTGRSIEMQEIMRTVSAHYFFAPYPNEAGVKPMFEGCMRNVDGHLLVGKRAFSEFLELNRRIRKEGMSSSKAAMLWSERISPISRQGLENKMCNNPALAIMMTPVYMPDGKGGWNRSVYIRRTLFAGYVEKTRMELNAPDKERIVGRTGNTNSRMRVRGYRTPAEFLEILRLTGIKVCNSELAEDIGRGRRIKFSIEAGGVAVHASTKHGEYALMLGRRYLTDRQVAAFCAEARRLLKQARAEAGTFVAGTH
jgi:hypothetical protein